VKEKDGFKIAIIHPHLVPRGGSEARALWMAEALKDDHSVTLVTMGKVNLAELNQYYGTKLQEHDIGLMEIPIPRVFTNRFDALRGYPLARYCKKISSEFEVMISSYGVMDFGRQGIQFIADVAFDDVLRRKFDQKPSTLKSIVYQKSFFRDIYLEFGRILAGTSKDGWRNNVTIANSRWTAAIMRDYFSINAGVIYPPVRQQFPEVAWGKKEDGFVYVGRLVPEKRIHIVIEILSQVRKRGHDVHFHIVGPKGDEAYWDVLQNLCGQNKHWVSLDGPMAGEEKEQFIAAHKFGINGRINEAFGIAVAEMVKAGCIVWVPNGGGQTEIVRNRTLTFDSTEDAICKMDRVLVDESLQRELLSHLSRQANRFGVDMFKSGIKVLFDEYLENHRGLQRLA